MRRKDREITNKEDLIKVMEKCDVCRIALNHDGYPYILPLNFGMAVREDKVELYFHGALEGMKYELMARDNRAGFEMDCGHRLVMEEDKGSCGMEYESVIGRGHMEMVPDSEKYEALCILMRHYHQEDFPFNQAAMPQTTVFKLVVESMEGKARRKKRLKAGFVKLNVQDF